VCVYKVIVKLMYRTFMGSAVVTESFVINDDVTLCMMM
jgi:hypothetical protein